MLEKLEKLENFTKANDEDNSWMIKFFMIIAALNFNEHGEIDQVLRKFENSDKFETIKFEETFDKIDIQEIDEC